MKLYTMPGACSLADHIALYWIGQPFDVRVLKREETKSPEYRAINPAGAVPALEDGDLKLTQNAAILNYLHDRFPGARLGGDGSARQRAEANRWLSFLNADVHPAFHPLFGMYGYLGEAGEDKAKEQARSKLRGLFERADQQLQGREWIAGFRSYADPYLFVVLRWAQKTGVDLSGLDNLARFRERMQADSGVQAALKAEGLN